MEIRMLEEHDYCRPKTTKVQRHIQDIQKTFL